MVNSILKLAHKFQIKYKFSAMEIEHGDHGLSKDHWDFIEKYLQKESGFFIKAIHLPSYLSPLPAALYGPSEGDAPVQEDEVHYASRNGRPGKSRLVNRPMRPGHYVIVIGIAGDKLEIFTAYGSVKGVIAPREPFDSSLEPAEKEESIQFWKTHALSDR